MTVQIERASIGLPAAAAIIVATFSVGGAVVYFETRLANAESRGARTERLIERICAKLECDKNGMRE